jgi:hypothetical protein
VTIWLVHTTVSAPFPDLHQRKSQPGPAPSCVGLNPKPAVAFAQDEKTLCETACSQFLSVTREAIGQGETYSTVIPAKAGIYAQKNAVAADI